MLNLGSMEADAAFGLFIQAIYKDSLQNPEKLSDGSEIYNDHVKELIEGVDTDESE